MPDLPDANHPPREPSFPDEPSPPIAPPIQPQPSGPARRQVTLDTEGAIAEDITCRKCGYNLQGLSIAAACPECALPIARSIRGDELCFSDPAWVKSLAQGVLLMLIGIFAVVGFGVLMGVGIAVASVAAGGAINPTVIIVFSSLLALPSLLMIIGAFRLTSPDPGQTETEPVISARKLARWLIVASVISIPLQLMSTGSGPTMTGTTTTTTTGTSTTTGTQTANVTFTAPVAPIQWLGMVSQTFASVGYIAALLYLSRLAVRIPNPSLASQTRIVMWGFIAFTAAGFLIGLAMLAILPSIMQQAMTPGAGGMPPPGLFIVGGLGLVLGCASIVFYIWAVVLLFRYRAAFTIQAGLAASNWIA